MCVPNNIVLLVTIEEFETNLVLVNVNKLKPYKYIEYQVYKKKKTNASIMGKECKWSSRGEF